MQAWCERWRGLLILAAGHHRATPYWLRILWGLWTWHTVDASTSRVASGKATLSMPSSGCLLCITLTRCLCWQDFKSAFWVTQQSSVVGVQSRERPKRARDINALNDKHVLPSGLHRSTSNSELQLNTFSTSSRCTLVAVLMLQVPVSMQRETW